MKVGTKLLGLAHFPKDQPGHNISESHCCGLNVYLLEFVYWNPILQCDGIWRWGLWEIISVRLGHESGALMMGFHSVQSLSHVQLFATPWIAAHQASLSITNSRSSLRLMSIKSVLPSSHLVLCRPLLLLPPIPPSVRVFPNESTLHNEVAKVLEFELQHQSFQWTPRTDPL